LCTELFFYTIIPTLFLCFHYSRMCIANDTYHVHTYTRMHVCVTNVYLQRYVSALWCRAKRERQLQYWQFNS